MHWLILTALAIIFRAVYGLTTKLISNHVHASSITQSFLLTSVACILSLPLSLVVGGISSSGLSLVWGTILLSILSATFGNILYFIGMNEMEASTSQIAFSSVLIWGVLLSTLFLGSRFSILQSAGIFLLFLAIILIQISKRKIVFTRGAVFIIASAALFSIFQITSAKVSTVVSPGFYLVLSYFGQSLILGVLYSKTILKDYKNLMRSFRKTVLTMVFASSMTLLYFTFSFFAYRAAPDRGVVVILLPSQVILAVILGIVFLKERTHVKRKLLAGALALVAGLLIKS